MENKTSVGSSGSVGAVAVAIAVEAGSTVNSEGVECSHEFMSKAKQVESKKINDVEQVAAVNIKCPKCQQI